MPLVRAWPQAPDGQDRSARVLGPTANGERDPTARSINVDPMDPRNAEAVKAMNTEQHAWSSDRALALAEWRTLPICGCGQDLDVCTGTHCPRCGTSLVAHAA